MTQATQPSRSAGYLVVDHVYKSFDGRTNAVDGVTLDVRQGEFVTFLGPSGSGKTTTLSMLAGFTDITRGDIRLRGASLAGVAPEKRNMGMVFQNYALFPHMSAADNVAFPLRMRKVHTAEAGRRARAMLEAVGLGSHADRLPRQLSGGQQQRVALARALVFEPDVLLLDEPLSALDKNLREQMQLEIKRLHRKFGMTTVFVTHDQSEAMTMSDRIAVFNAGKVEQFAPALEVYSSPATRFVGGFVGDSNFFDVQAEDAPNGRYAAPVLGGTVAARSSGHAAGAQLAMMIRPEAFTLAPLEPQAAEGHQGAAQPFTCEGIVDYGASLLLEGRCGAAPVRVRVQRGASPGAAWREGARYRLVWRPDDAHIVPRA
ncbi:ABC transporter ATP-binding protein [Bordetella genomosp. 13]|uniref:ABC transporter domain-containing protein n=1 Tax=Bordetella genomosp. 13 TaxID=463040 RepID=A0A1W6ZBA2_9BORD|nr:ABC transporter ATP-binding protein [Bordetella genomosp. 13]ARP94124.1 hypothetical protein CAL15_06835 [Bordetella genomosp. 13]